MDINESRRRLSTVADRRLSMRTLPHDPRKLAAIYAGGVAGALIRVGLAQAIAVAPGAWPWATFAVNMAGALLLGYFFALFRDHPEESLHHPFLGIGLCGTLTTFSTMQLELFEMVDGGYLALAAAYCAVTIAAGFLCLRLGIGLERRRPEIAA
jgi:fluoride exporter